ncbi:MAG: methylated-DNA--[protein]-cysteine S-methyltransferase [Mycobacteriaceae bacterium]
MRTHTVLESPVGELTLVHTDGVLSGLYLPEHARRPALSSFGERTGNGFTEIGEQLAEYFAGQRTVFTVSLAPVGTDFQQRVWALLRAIPYGQTRTYAQLADELGNRRVIRAVGSANARNPISVVVPCHRVIGTTGALTGYAGGLARKEFLLTLEDPVRADQPPLF